MPLLSAPDASPQSASNEPLAEAGAPALAIIGMAGRFPGAATLEEFWQNLVGGVDSVTQFSNAELEESTPRQNGSLPARHGASSAPHGSSSARHGSIPARAVLADVDYFDADFFGIYPREAEQMDPQHRVFLECAWEALERAGHNPEAFPGLIGIFAGCSMNTYFMHNLMRDRSHLAAFAEGYQSSNYKTMLGNDKDFLPTRISYKLNLRGPSLSIQTACSTSLVAVAQACQSLLTFACDMALAGGVSITFPQRRSYVPEEGGILSTDGRIRPFDKLANGTVFGHGAGVVLLKRLDDAVADRDHILAVIRGFAVNNDGSQRAGYTAPSREGQAQAIAAAQAMAGFDPATISYVEAHGTGTPLGDPIEVAGLTQAFRIGTQRRQYCALSTVKAHVGHLDVASGVTGLIKTVLQMQYRKIPGLLHFSEPNPALLLDDSPFVIHAQTMDWLPIDGLLRAGVSSFGVGGTNAHVVLEAPPPPSKQPLIAEPCPQLLPLSARTPTALSAMQQRLADRIESSANNDLYTLPNIAFTLQSGRKEFACRRAVVAGNREQAIALLRKSADVPIPCSITGSGTGSIAHADRVAAEQTPTVAFLFPGQGAQFPDMGRLLFEQFPVFRAVIEDADRLVRPTLADGLIPWLYAPHASGSAEAIPAEHDSQHRLNQTSIAQPAIFAVSYALARLWQTLGVEPALLIGHSIGEFVAASLAGTLSFADALQLVVARGAIIQQLPTGSMLAVRASEAQVGPYLDGQTDLASVNGPQAIVVAGAHQHIETLAARLSRAGIAARKLSTSHAFHSRMMDDALAPFARVLEKVTFRAPHVPWISTLTGEVVNADEVTQGDYWLRQLRSPVLFGRAATQASANGVTLFLEVGPGQTLCNLLKQNGLLGGKRTAVATLTLSGDGREAATPFRNAVAKVWEEGLKIRWEALESKPQGRSVSAQRVPLPTYPFERRRYWVDPPPALELIEQQVQSNNFRTADSEPITDSDGATRSDQAAPEALSMSASPRPGANDQSVNGRLIAAVKSLVTELSDLDLSQTPPETSWMQLGLDSLFLTQLTQAVRTTYGVKLSFRQMMSEHSTIAALAAHLAAAAPPEKLPASPPTALPAAASVGAEPTSAPLPGAADTNAALPVPTPGSADAYAALFAQQMAAMSALMQRQLDMLSAVSGQVSRSGNLAVSENPARLSPVDSRHPAGQPAGSEQQRGDKQREQENHLGTILPLRPAEAAQSKPLSADQAHSIHTLLERYSRKTVGSKAHAQRYRDVLADPRVASGFNQQLKEAVYPLVIKRAKGAHLWDLDGNRYVDILNGYGSILFGHSPDFVVDAVKQQLEAGFPIGPQTELAGECAEMLTTLVGLERATFCNTGSEAVMAALRLARTVTGRSLVVVFAGSYHGQIDEVLVKSTRTEKSIPTAPGIPNQSVANMLVLEYGSAHALEVIRRRADEIAAVLVEPVQSRHPELQPVAFLKELRSITEQAGAALIFDEVVTGFRSHLGGAQKLFDIRADLATYGKVVAGGMPIGVVAGSRTYMDALDGGSWQFGDDSAPQVGVTFFAGTFVRHPLTMAAVKATLTHLRSAGPALQERLTSTTTELVRDLNSLFQSHDFPTRLRHFASWFYFALPAEAQLARLLYIHLREQGVHLQEGFPCFLTTAHGAAELKQVRDAFGLALEEMRVHGMLGEATTPSLPPVNATCAAAEAPISEPQREILLASQRCAEASCAFNESVTLYLSGRLDEASLQAALDQVVSRHEALRLTIGDTGETIKVAPGTRIILDRKDWRHLANGEQQKVLRALLQSEATTPFHLQEGPLVRAALVLLAEEQAAVVFTGHHIVVDGWSMNQIFAEWGKIYTRLAAANDEGTDTALLPVHSYLEQARNERTHTDSDAEAYWLETFRTLPPPLDLPTDRPRPSQRTYAGATLRHILAADLTAKLRAASARNGNTLFSTLLSACAILLGRLANEQDIVIGIPIAGQGRFAGQSVVGHAVHFLPVRIEVSPDTVFRAFSAQVQGKVYDALDHQECTLGTLLRKLKVASDPGRLTLGEIQFNLEQLGPGLHFAGLQTRLETNPKAAVNADIFFNFIDRGSELVLECDYNTSLFHESTIRRWGNCLETLLDAVALQPSEAVEPVGHLRWLPSSMQQQVLVDWNKTTTPYPSALPVHAVFEQQAQQTPSAVALRFGNRSLTYRELNEEANRFARLLLGRHTPGASLRIAVSLERSPELIIALIGTLKAGGQYIPIDPSYPAARLSLLLADAEPSLFVVDRPLMADLQTDLTTLTLEDLAADLALESPEDLELSVSAESPAYMMYTSGSTGQPKGVVIPHRAITRLVLGTDFIHFSREETFLQLAPVSFDASTLEIWGALLHGATLVLMPGSKPSPEEIGATIEKYGVTTLWLTAALFHLMVMDHLPLLAPLRQLIAGGDVLSVHHVRKALEALPQLRLVNGYGPTENTTFTCCHTIRSEGLDGVSSVPIGRPIANTRVYILDVRHAPVPIGVPGELYAAGDGLSLGYWKAAELTAEKFIEIDLPLVGRERLYRTGDLARYREDGSIEFLGRRDNQIKVRGFRVEPREIEAAAERFPGVRAAIACARRDWTMPMDVPGDTRVVLYLLLDANSDQVNFADQRRELAAFLRAHLPEAMQPAAILEVKEFPRTLNGKVDHRALPLPSSESLPRPTHQAAPRNPLEAKLVSIWEKVLQLDSVGIEDSIFELGGDSLSIFRITTLANQAGIGVTAQQLFQYKTIASLSPRLEETEASLAGPALARPAIRSIPREQFRKEPGLAPVEP